ncbi:MAG: S8 family serine peptidase [Gammaproteobacteria bacterium]|nr:S8 family serine peptidase [Gammaproteobacteria bacterium]
MKQLNRKCVVLFGIGAFIFLLFVVAVLKPWVSKWNTEFVVSDRTTEADARAIKQITNYESIQTKKQTVLGASKPKVDVVSKRKRDSFSNVRIDSYGDSIVSVNKKIRKGRIEADESRNSPSGKVFENGEWLNATSSIDALLQQAEDANRHWTFGWIRLKHPLQSIEIDKGLRRMGALVLGQSGDLVRLKVPKDRRSLEAISQISWITGIGALPPAHKLSGDLNETSEDNTQSAFLPVFVVVMTSKMEDMFRTELEKIGLGVGHFDASIRTFAAVMRRGQLSDLAALDFVQAVEPITEARASHDSAIPAVGGDALRSVASSFGSYSGVSGISVPIGVMDTGLNANHIALSSNRKSICGSNFIEGEDNDLWNDNFGHGTHVTGTVVGNGYFQPKYAGVAPGVEHIRFAKVLSTRGTGSTSIVIQGMDFLATTSSCPEEGWTADRVKPLIVNMSLSNRSLEYDGRSTGPRKVDSIVWTHRQVYVVSNANAAIYGYSNYASGKNSIGVGAVHDNGDLADFSSHGPTVDGRLLPLVVGPGVGVMSAEGNGSYDGYRLSNGTSMSAPCVAGVATLLMDASPDHREEPALVRARLMASAVKPEAWLNSEALFPKDNTGGPGTMQAKYGMGLVSARTSIVNRDVPEGWASSGATLSLENGEYAYEDIVVPAGTSRLDVVLTWDEPPADTIASTVLNDLDLWLDHGADCGSSPCGEHSSQSRIDNVEWVIIQDPEPGTYRIQISGERIFTEAPRAAVAWTMIRGSATPQLTVETDQTEYEVASGEEHNHHVGLTISTDGYVAAGSVLHVDCRTADDEPCESFGFSAADTMDFFRNFRGSVQREDSITVDKSHVQDVYLGEVGHGEEQRVFLHLASKSEGPLTIYLTVTAWNGESASNSIIFRELDSEDEPSGETQTPPNDAFDSPTVLASAGGVLEIDTLLATSESGEPIRNSTGQRPTQSLWFQWTAEQSGLASFVVSPRIKLPSWYLLRFKPVVDVFLTTGYCCGIASAKYIGSADWSVQFFAEQGKEYRIRVGGSNASMPLTLNWLFGERPPNDNFANATTLTGASGSVAGHNLGATIEPGEIYGTLTSTIWYRWTAPEDGDWEFQIEDAQTVHVLVFSGDTIDDLRLVSGIAAPGEPVSVATAQDEIYYIMVASPNSLSGGWKFDELNWEQQTDARGGWDWFDTGLQLSTSESGNVFLSHLSSFGVEPNEPEATGVQTGWRKWTSPGDGLYTWYWDSPELQLNAFFGTSVGELSSIDAGTNNLVARGSEFVFDATEGEEYAISVGRAEDSNRAFTHSTSSSTGTWLRWGKTPTNNWISGAISLNGSSGNVVGSNQFATTGSSVRTHLGYSSLWYSYEAAETGWFRFWLADVGSTSILSAFHPTESNLNPELIMASRTNRISGEGIEVIVYIEQGSRVLLRVGTTRAHSSSAFELHWSPTDPPNWLVYRGRVASGHRDASGQVISLSGLADMAFNSDGTFLFVSTNVGISVFERELTTGDLTLTQEISDPSGGSFLVWDQYRDRLYAHSQDTWWTFSTSSDDSSEFVLDSTDHGIGSHSNYKSDGSPVLFMGNSGDYLYRSTNFSQSIFAFNSDSTLDSMGNNSVVGRAIFPSIDGNYWWRWQSNELQLLGREVGKGSFHAISKPWINSSSASFTGTFSSDDEYFYTATREARSQANFTVHTIDYLTGAIEPSLSERFFGLGLVSCAGVIPRTGSYVVDVLCSYGGYVVEYSPDDGELRLSDVVANVHSRQRTRDRFGRLIPRYTLSSTNLGATPVEASPDGRHVYLATRDQGLLYFERFGNEVSDLTDPEALPILRLDLLQASKNQIQFDDDTAEDGCLAASDWVVDNVSYSVVDSKWQQRTLDSSWSDIEGTEETEQLCSYSPSDSNEYRMVATFTRDGETIEFASNFFGEIVYERLERLTVESDEITLDTLSITECTDVLNLVVNDVKYTVKESKWQERDSSNSDWSDIASTITAGELCPYDPNDTREYRLVGRFVIDDEEDYYASNVLQEESE